MKFKQSSFGVPPAVPPKVAAPTGQTFAQKVDALLEAGKLVEARGELEAALARSSDTGIKRAYAMVCLSLNDPEAALAAMAVKSTVPAGRAVELLQLGTVYELLNRNDEAIEAYLEAKALTPFQPTPYINASRLLAKEARIEEAEDILAEGLRRCQFGRDNLLFQQATLLPAVYESREQLIEYRETFAKRIGKIKAIPPKVDLAMLDFGTPGFFLTYQAENDRDLMATIAEAYARCVPTLVWHSPHFKGGPTKRDPNAKIKVGFISSNFRRHTVGQVTIGVIKSLPREHFEVAVIVTHSNEDEMSLAIYAAADRVVKVSSQFQDAREQIAAEEFDAIIYADIGMLPFTYTLGFSRLAPVQCAAWGHPDTTGIPTIDYYLSADTFEPPNAQDAYTEKLVRLGRIYCDMERPASVEVNLPRSRFDLPNDVPLYLCAQSMFKLHPDFDDVLAGILDADPAGIVLISAGMNENWNGVLTHRLAAALGPRMDRIRVIPRVDKEEFPGLLRMADALLDPIHFTGGYTTYLTFAAGLPIVTWDGQLMRGRMTAGLYRQMGLGGLIAKDADEFVSLAVRLANDAEFRLAKRREIGARAHLLFNDSESIGELGAFLEAAVDASVDGELVDWQPRIKPTRPETAS